MSCGRFVKSDRKVQVLPHMPEARRSFVHNVGPPPHRKHQSRLLTILSPARSRVSHRHPDGGSRTEQECTTHPSYRQPHPKPPPILRHILIILIIIQQPRKARRPPLSRQSMAKSPTAASHCYSGHWNGKRLDRRRCQTAWTCGTEARTPCGGIECEWNVYAYTEFEALPGVWVESEGDAGAWECTACEGADADVGGGEEGERGCTG